MADEPWVKPFPHPIGSYIWDDINEKWIPLVGDVDGRLQVYAAIMGGYIDVSGSNVAVSFPDDLTWTYDIDAVDMANTAETDGMATVGISISGTWVGTFTFQATQDGITYYTYPFLNVISGTLQSSTTVNGIWIVPCAGFSRIRIRSTLWTSGTATTKMRASVLSNIGGMPLTDAQLRASDVKISLDSEVVATTSVANSTASGVIEAENETVECLVSPGAGTIGCQLEGSWAAAGNYIIFEATIDGAIWHTCYANMANMQGIVVNLANSITAGNGLYLIGGAGYVKVRARGYSTWNPGTCTVSFNSTVGTSPVILASPLPQGTNILGKISILGPSTAAVSKVASSIINITLKAANSSRLGLSIYNDSTKTLYVKYGAIAALDDFTVKIFSQGYLELPYPCYTGIVDGIWDVADGNAFVTETIL
jgi:hypothetical protein